VGAPINWSAENPAERRQFLKSATAAGLGPVGAGMLSSAASTARASADQTAMTSGRAIFSFALNLEYLEAGFYSHVWMRTLRPFLQDTRWFT
jgi:hypothetical protein